VTERQAVMASLETVTTELLVPPPEPPPQPPSAGPRDWLRRNLFRSPLDVLVTLIFGAVAAYVLFLALRFVFVSGRWDIVRVNLRLLMVGRFPTEHLARISVSLIVLAGWGGVLGGIVRAHQLRAGRVVAQGWKARTLDLVSRFWVAVAVTLLLLLLTTTAGPWLTAAGVLAAAFVGRILGGLVGRVRLGALGGLALTLVLAAVPVALFFYLVDAAGFDDWEGFMLNLFLAVCAMVLCFPLGVLFALGRRSKLPLIRALSTAYIEIVRGAPLFVLLLLANVALQFFIPRDLAPSTVTRAIAVFTVFTAAYMAEIIRGGLQAVPRGQYEAAKALGLSPVKQTALIVLPQALRNVIPAQIGQLISLFKDTTLAGAAMSLFELLAVSEAITQQGDFRGQGLIGETIAFAALLFWAVSYTMSRESQRLERRLGVGVR
jgi:general L-amino acid transport system permease protein